MFQITQFELEINGGVYQIFIVSKILNCTAICESFDANLKYFSIEMQTTLHLTKTVFKWEFFVQQINYNYNNILARSGVGLFYI